MSFIKMYTFLCAVFFLFYLAALKNIGEKTTNLFERKKKEVGDLTTEKASEAQAYAEEQAKKAGEAIDETKNEASGILAGACKFDSFCN